MNALILCGGYGKRLGSITKKTPKPLVTIKKKPFISVCTPTYNRRPFIKNLIEMFKSQTYPKELIEWIIVDDGTDKIEDLVIDIPQVKYFKYDIKLPLGKKRNITNEKATGDIIVNMDDDDLYLPSYLNHSIDILMNHQTDITGSLDMLFIYPRKDYQMSYIRCDRNFRFYHEATLCMKKTHWKKYKYTGSNQGEGENIYGNAKYCSLSDIIKCMICVCWEGNTINKDIFLKNHINMKIHGTGLTILKKVLSDSHKMEGDTPAIQLEKKSVIINPTEKIEINLELLLNIRNLITVTNDRINWKIEELLPVGIIIQQIDESLKNHNQ